MREESGEIVGVERLRVMVKMRRERLREWGKKRK